MANYNSIYLKKIFTCLVICLSCCFNGFSQSESYVVNYQYYDGLFDEYFNAFLTVGKSNTIYHVDMNDDKQSQQPKFEGSTISLGGKNNVNVYKSLQKHKLYSIESFDGKKWYKVVEVIPDLTWKILNESKHIGEFHCVKATTTFRGRDYVAWFTDDIVISTGPWKFHGLPGLVVSLKDTAGRYSWSLVSFKTSNKPELNDSDWFPDADLINLKSYRILVDEYMNQLRARIKSKLPKNITYSVPKNKRLGLELIYEWESKK